MKEITTRLNTSVASHVCGGFTFSATTQQKNTGARIHATAFSTSPVPSMLLDTVSYANFDLLGEQARHNSSRQPPISRKKELRSTFPTLLHTH
ncbi:hypothetical protein PI124_g12080 [Phytophthora idaei]|nr:hypothetical protein PI126_g11123 [Phytophthora idaei]KAG3243102.1 hypothetical protein PI124_g12080 [Phytophthora idaei]